MLIQSTTKVRMNEKDRIHFAFIIERGIYCYKVMLFCLKNVGATCQRLINNMFFKLMGDTVEAYIDNMVIKSKVAKNHIRDTSEVFEIFRQFKIKLNPLKCGFGLSSGQLLGHIVSKRGIEPSPMQVKTLSQIESQGL